MGSMHRNTYIHSPSLLDSYFTLKDHSRTFFAGQITGVEGYVESAAVGQWVGIAAYALATGKQVQIPPRETALGSLIHSVTNLPEHGKFSPMNINFGLFPPLENPERKKEIRRKKNFRQV